MGGMGRGGRTHGNVRRENDTDREDTKQEEREGSLKHISQCIIRNLLLYSKTRPQKQAKPSTLTHTLTH